MSHLASQLKACTTDFKNNEKEFYVKLKEFHGEEESKSKIDDQYFVQELQKQESLSKHSDEEITNIVKSINDLASIFKDLSSMVVEQGSILDRIDFNIEAAKEDTKQAVVHIQKTYEAEKSKRAGQCIKCQLTFIAVLLIVIAIKFM